MLSCRGWFTLFYLFLASRLLVSSSDEPAKCTVATFNWTFNEHGQSPCDLARILDHVCFPNELAYPDKLDPQDPKHNIYNGPDSSFTNKCDCSSVQYSIIQACALCQGGTIDAWGDWIHGCQDSDISVGTFPPGFPNGTSIPVWAFLDVTADNEFVANKAFGIAGTSPDLTTNPIRVDNATSSTIGTSTVFTSKPFVTGPATRKSGTNIAAIVGGVLGGLLLIVLFVSVLFIVHYRRRAKKVQTEVMTPVPYVSSIYSERPVTSHYPVDLESPLPPPVYSDGIAAQDSRSQSLASPKALRTAMVQGIAQT